jgi:hypothetical protein
MITFTPDQETTLRRITGQWRVAQLAAAASGNAADVALADAMATEVANLVADIVDAHPTGPAPTAPPEPGQMRVLATVQRWIHAPGDDPTVGRWDQVDELDHAKLGDAINWGETKLTEHGAGSGGWYAVLYPYLVVSATDPDGAGGRKFSSRHWQATFTEGGRIVWDYPARETSR